ELRRFTRCNSVGYIVRSCDVESVACQLQQARKRNWSVQPSKGGSMATIANTRPNSARDVRYGYNDRAHAWWCGCQNLEIWRADRVVLSEDMKKREKVI